MEAIVVVCDESGVVADGVAVLDLEDRLPCEISTGRGQQQVESPGEWASPPRAEVWEGAGGNKCPKVQLESQLTAIIVTVVQRGALREVLSPHETEGVASERARRCQGVENCA